MPGLLPRPMLPKPGTTALQGTGDKQKAPRTPKTKSAPASKKGPTKNKPKARAKKNDDQKEESDK